MVSTLAKDRIRDAAVLRDTVDPPSAPGAAGRGLVAVFRSSRVRLFAVPAAVVTLLSIHAGLLAYAATRYSLTLDEPAHLAAGLCHWRFGRFELYRVNPPLVRMVAALPVMLVGYQMDWSSFHDEPGARPEFRTGAAFMAANGERSLRLITVARWGCIPFSAAGGVFAFAWSKQAFRSDAAGLLALTLWTFDPAILGHGALITPDVAATSFSVGAGWSFWCWTQSPNLRTAAVAGLLLGVASTAKFTAFILPAVWIALTCLLYGRDAIYSATCITKSHRLNLRGSHFVGAKRVGHLILSMLIACTVLHAAYGFTGVGTRIGDLAFVSSPLRGPSNRFADNRFSQTWFSELPCPIPEQAMVGIDIQARELEQRWVPSYLSGSWRAGGWWYFYLYGAAVKTPHGTQLLLLLSAVYALFRRHSANSFTLVSIVLPAVAILTVLSSHDNVTHHTRYALPAWGHALVLAGGAGALMQRLSTPRHVAFAVFSATAAAAVSPLIHIPHSLSYFNELSGGPSHGYRHLVLSNLDWGQNAELAGAFAYAASGRQRPVFIEVAYDTRPIYGYASRTASRAGFDIDFELQNSPDGCVVVSATALTLDTDLVGVYSPNGPGGEDGLLVEQLHPTLFLVTRKESSVRDP
ncbi:MAG: glycosyltransferase family 39 protein [Planctomycetota bacterium]|nr:glycosyltransferase family 39 protein [Planctomycetota bacterium]